MEKVSQLVRELIEDWLTEGTEKIATAFCGQGKVRRVDSTYFYVNDSSTTPDVISEDTLAPELKQLTVDNYDIDLSKGDATQRPQFKFRQSKDLTRGFN